MSSDVRFTERDFDAIRADILASIPALAPSWTSHGEDEIAVALVELLAGVSDGLHYYIDKTTLENFLTTAALRRSAIRLAHMLHYRPKRWSAASGTIVFTPDGTTTTEVVIPAMSEFTSKGGLPLLTAQATTIPVGSTAPVSVPAYQAVRKSLTHVSTGSDPERVSLPTTDKVAEQLFEVRTPAGTWYDAYEHPLDTDLQRFYYQLEDDEGVRYVEFRSSRGPVPSSSIPITVRYLHTQATNIQAGGEATGPTGLLGLDQFTITLSEFSGASAPETIAQIRDRAPANVFSRDRAVTSEDYQAIGGAVPGVKSVYAKKDPYGWRSVDVYVAPDGGGVTSTTLLNEVRDELLLRNEITVDVQTWAPSYKTFDLTVEVKNLPAYLSPTVVNNVDAALRELFSFDNVDFAKPIRVGDLYAEIEAVEGVDYSVITALHWDGEAVSVSSLVPVNEEYPVLGTLTITAIS